MSTPSVVLTGYPPCQGTPPCSDPRVPPWQGTPPAGPVRVPPRQGRQGTPRVPPAGYPLLDLAGYPPGRVPPSRVPPPLAGYPPGLPHGILRNVAKHYGIWVPPLGVDKLTRWNYYLPVVLRTRAVIIQRRIPTLQINKFGLPPHRSIT